MRILIVGDLHIDEKSIPEIKEIFENDIFPVKADKIIQVGDYYHSNFPSAAELKFGTELATLLVKQYKNVVILSGTGAHDMCRGSSVIEYLESVRVTTVKGDYIYTNLLFGHWSTNESKLNFGHYKYTISELNKYQFVFLGHEHIPQDLSKTIFHIGSVRYVSFGEVGTPKRIALLEDDKLSWIPLTATIPMVDAKNLTELETLSPKCKVRLVYSDFNTYKKEASEANRLLKRFTEGKIKLDFVSQNTPVSAKTETINKDKLIQNYITNIQDKEVKKLIEENLQ